jgi:hypothetical protein
MPHDMLDLDYLRAQQASLTSMIDLLRVHSFTTDMYEVALAWVGRMIAEQEGHDHEHTADARGLV